MSADQNQTSRPDQFVEANKMVDQSSAPESDGAVLCITCGAIGTEPCSLPRCGFVRRGIAVKMSDDRVWVADDDRDIPRVTWAMATRAALRQLAVKWGLA